MIPVLYTATNTLKENLKLCDGLKDIIISGPFDIFTSLRLSFEAKAAKTFYAFSLSSTQLDKTYVIKVLKGEKKNKKDKDFLAITKLQEGLLEIKEKWRSNSSEFSLTDCLNLYKKACTGSVREEAMTDLKHILGYVQVSREHPVVKAGLAFILCYKINPFDSDSRLFSHLIFNLFLSKEGYDMKNLFCLDHYFFDHKENFQKELDQAERKENLTAFLEYISQAMLSQTKFVADVVKHKGSLLRTGIPKRFWHITKRQKDISNLSSIPISQLTNSKVQKLFKVSQITASRDLSKLDTLGLLQTHGKGRSVYYTHPFVL